MSIDPLSSRRLSSPGPGKRVRNSDAGSSFSETMVDQADDSPPISSASGPVALDALLALQELPAQADDRSVAHRRGEELLDALEQLRLGLLCGGVPAQTLERLHRLASEQAAQSDNPRLSEVLQEIELRAAVELAKLGH